MIMDRFASLAPTLPKVCRLGLATRGNTKLDPADVHWAVEQGVNYLNWCGKPDGLSQAIAEMGTSRPNVVVATQFKARTAAEAEREFDWILNQTASDRLEVATMYYVESDEEWQELIAPGGALQVLERRKREGQLSLIGLTTHQRRLAAEWATEGRLDLLMIRYNAAHRGAEQDVFPNATELGLPVVTFTGLRWRALLEPTPSDPPGATPANRHGLLSLLPSKPRRNGIDSRPKRKPRTPRKPSPTKRLDTPNQRSPQSDPPTRRPGPPPRKQSSRSPNSYNERTAVRCESG